MSDEAAPYYVDMVDQQTIGHQFLLRHLGPKAAPKTGWQVDPFGHSTTMAVLYSLMGMDAWVWLAVDVSSSYLSHRSAVLWPRRLVKKWVVHWI